MLENIFFMIFWIYVFSWIVLIIKIKDDSTLNFNIEKNRVFDAIIIILLCPLVALVMAFDYWDKEYIDL